MADSPFHSVQACRSGQKKFLWALGWPGDILWEIHKNSEGVLVFIRWRSDWFKFWVYFRVYFQAWTGRCPVQNYLGVLIKYLNSQVHSGSAESELTVVELNSISSGHSHEHKISRSSSSFQISFLESKIPMRYLENVNTMPLSEHPFSTTPRMWPT